VGYARSPLRGLESSSVCIFDILENGTFKNNQFRGQECPRHTFPEQLLLKIFEVLRARRKPAEVGQGQAQVFVGIYRDVVDADFVVEMRAGRAAA
jgi:hypothetical protein